MSEWRKSFTERLLDFSARIILLANKLPKSSVSFVISNQMVKSGTSIGANFVESQDASSSKDFVQKLSIALREGRETWYWLKVIERTKLLSYDEVRDEITESEEIIAVLVTSIKKSKNNI